MQLSLFDDNRTPDEVVTDSANTLLDSLNDGLKETEYYEPQYYFQQNEMIVLIAANKQKNMLFNIIDSKGKIPSGFSANWRTAIHIKQELKL